MAMNFRSAVSAAALLFLGGLCASGQTTREEVLGNLHDTRAHYSVYPAAEHSLTEAPDGYEAVYLTHYGRHGSRHQASIDPYRDACLCLEEGHKAGILTDLGESLLTRVYAMYQDAVGREGGLTPSGVKEHRGIAERMYKAYPQIFGENPRISCRATTSPRCILSMAEFTGRLKELDRDLVITRSAYDRDEAVLRNDRYLDPRRPSVTKIQYAYLKEQGLDYFAFAHRLFKEVQMDDRVCMDFMMDVYALYQITGCVSHLDISLDDVFTPEELYLLWKAQNWRNYLQCGNSALHGEGVLGDSKVLLLDFVGHADKALAEGKVAVDLRFGHDIAISPMLALIDLNGLGIRSDDPETVLGSWADFKTIPMATNFQMVFYRHKKDSHILVKLLHNEKESRLPIETDRFPYYDWTDVREYFLGLAGDACVEDGFPSKWLFSKQYMPLYEKDWKENHIIKATAAGSGTIRALSSDGKSLGRYGIKKERPMAGPVKSGDYLLFEFPVDYLPEGSVISFDAVMTAEKGAPAYWQVEWLDGGKWKQGKTMHVFGPAFGKTHKYATVYQTFRLSDPVYDSVVKVRVRALEGEGLAVGEDEASADVMLVTQGYVGAYAQDFGTSVPKDTVTVLCIGNSFTYFSSVPSLLKEIAWNEGHYIEPYATVKGGRAIADHLELNLTQEMIARGGYDYVFLNDHSQGPGKVGRDRKANSQLILDVVEMAARLRKASPECRLIMEWTWAYSNKDFGGFGSYDAFSSYGKKGTEIIAKAVGGDIRISPIEQAFKTVRKERPDIKIYHKDNHHQSLYGAYLKACVNYLMLFGEPFGDSPADCLVPPHIASYLRDVAERVVL